MTSDLDLRDFAQFTEVLTTPCVVWRGATSNGYGQVRMHGKVQPAHIWAYEHTEGPVPLGRELHHLCGNKLCVRPDHLLAETHGDHMVRWHRFYPRKHGTRTPRAPRTHCVNGHALAGSGTYVEGTSEGSRLRCRVCKNLRHERYQARRELVESAGH